MFMRFARRRGWLLAAAVVAAAVTAPLAWAATWVNVGQAEIHLNEIPTKDVGTQQPRDQDNMRIFVGTHSPCGGPNFWEQYLYPNGDFYAFSGLEEVCTAGETPAYFGVNGGNKYAICGEDFNEPTDPASTCQRHSTTS